jgi:hypothetical protein
LSDCFFTTCIERPSSSRRRFFCKSALTMLMLPIWLSAQTGTNAKKLTEEDRIELLRGLGSEFATVRAFLPRSQRPLPFPSDGNYDKEKWQEMGRQMGAAARVGDQVQITRVGIEPNRIILDINGGLRQRRGSLKDHVQIGASGPVMTSTTATQQPQTGTAALGTTIEVMFPEGVPGLKADDVKKILRPVLEFDKETATENYVDNLPEPVQQAIKAKKAIVGMDRDQVVLAMGKPRHKERSTQDGNELEDWVYGDPPGKVTFITFHGSKVAKVKEAYADIGGSTATPLPPR